MPQTQRVIEIVGVSTESWDAAGRDAVPRLAGAVREIQAAEIVKQDLLIERGAVVTLPAGSAGDEGDLPPELSGHALPLLLDGR
jgi:flavin-binding protein dodecin